MTAPAINPLHPDTRSWLGDLYAQTAARLYYAGAPLDVARAKAKTFALSFRDALLDETLIDMEPNVILREMRAGMVPEEFRP
jgi:hypothetical protein